MRLSLGIVFCVFVLVQSAFAHQPQAIELEYNSVKESLTIVVSHYTDDKNDHYIKRVEILMNGSEISSKSFFRQIDKTRVKFDLPLKAKEGDVIGVKAYCKKGGVLDQSLVVAKGEESKSGSIAASENSSVSADDANTMDSGY